MGGSGSGPQRRGGRKRTVESCPAVEVRDLKRLNLLSPGRRQGVLSWGTDPRRKWNLAFVLAIGDGSGSLRLTYRVTGTGEAYNYQVGLAATPCRFGGRQWWLVCPLRAGGVECGRRVRAVYRAGAYFGCRHCHGLTYASTQNWDPRVAAFVRGGRELDALGDVRGMSLPGLGFCLKVIAERERRLERVRRRLWGGTPPAQPRIRRH